MAYTSDQNAGGLDALTSATLATGDLAVVGDVSDSNRAKGLTIANLTAYIAALAETLTNKTISLASNTVTGTTAEFNTALSDANFATGGGTVSGASSGTNTGDQTSIVGITGTKAQFDTAVSDGNIVYVGDTITLAENTSIALDPAGSADGKYTGITVTGTGGTTIAFGDLIYLAVADSRWELTDADASSTAGPVMIGMAVSTSTDGNPVTVLLQGIIRADSKFPALTIGAPVYVDDTTAGAIKVTIPTGADNVIRVVGFALTADEIYFNPSQDHQVTVA